MINTVLVVDNQHYLREYAEDTPFEAIVIDEYDTNIVVRSIKTDKEYERYTFQVTEI